MRISYCYDTWAADPLARLGPGQERPQRPLVSLADAHTIAQVFAPENDELKDLMLNEEEDDRILRRWEGNGSYSAKSIYKILIGIGKINWPFMEVWKSKLPPTVKVFAIMMLRDKILTHEVMERRNMNCALNCVMFNNCPIESIAHLFFLCPYATHVWYLVSQMWGYRLMRPQGTVWEIWRTSRSMCGQRKTGEWAVQFVATLWTIWKQRNCVVFGGAQLRPEILADRAYQDGKLWIKHG